MSAIQPNMDFDKQRKEHTPYNQKTAADMKAVYDRLQKEQESERYRAVAIRNGETYNKWFKTK